MTTSTTTTDPRYQKVALTLACVATFMLMMDVTVINIALPQIRQELSADLADQQWIIASYTLPLAAFLLAGGVLGDRLGRRRVLVGGLVVFTLSSLVAGLAGALAVLEIARALQGVGAAVLFAVSPALIAQEFEGPARAKAYGLFGAVTGLSLAIGPIVGGVLTLVDWRWIFLVNVPVGVVLVVAALRRGRDLPAPGAGRLPVLPIVVSAVGLAAIAFGIIESERVGWSAVEVWASIVAGVVLVALFLVGERRPDRGLLDLGLLRNRTYAGVLVATFLSNATSLAGLFLVVSFLQNVLDLSSLGAGLVLLPLTLVLFVVAAVTGSVMDRVAPGLLLGGAILLIAVGLALLALADAEAGWVRLLPGLVVMGAGMGMFNPPRSVLTVGVVPAHQAGLASGIGETFQQVGVVLGIAAFGAAFQDRVVDAAPSAAVGRLVASGDLASLPSSMMGAAQTWFSDGLSVVMVACGIVCAVGAAVAFATIRSSDLHVPDEASAAEVAA